MEYREFAEAILFSTTLEEKLLSPEVLTDSMPGSEIEIPIFPGRPANLSFKKSALTEDRKKIAFPNREALAREESSRGQALHFFANHELLAMELMALVLLRFPDAPSSFRRGIVNTIKEEQRHLGMYQSRMEEFSVGFGDIPVNSFFWDTLKNISSPLDYTIKMSMTFEQANLDFSKYFRDLFFDLGDEVTGTLLDTVYQEEIGHVAYGVAWFEKLKDPNKSDWEVFESTLQLPLSPSRAKGIIFDEEARIKAGLSLEFIEKLKIFSQSKGRPPVVRFLNFQSEEEWGRHGKAFAATRDMIQLEKDDCSLLSFLSGEGDIAMVSEIPNSGYQRKLQEAGFVIPQYICWDQGTKELPKELTARKIDRIEPWGLSPSNFELSGNKSVSNDLSELVSKKFAVQLASNQALKPYMKRKIIGGREIFGRVVSSPNEIEAAIKELTEFTGTVVIKAPFGSSGRNMIRCRDFAKLEIQYKNWITKNLRNYRTLIIEPWLDKKTDLSILIDVKPNGESKITGTTRFFTTANGQYLGHFVGKKSGGIPSDVMSSFGQKIHSSSEENAKEEPYAVLKEIGLNVAAELAERGYVGPAGIDSLVYQMDGESFLKPIVEINVRYTMGHIANKLAKRIAPGAEAIWRHFSLRELKKSGFESFSAFQSDCETKFPLKIKHGSKPFVESGVFFTTDTTQSKFVTSFLQVADSENASREFLLP